MRTGLRLVTSTRAVIRRVPMILIGFTVPIAVFAQQTAIEPLTAAQVNQAAMHFREPGQRVQSLHVAKISFKDGAKGYSTWISPELPSNDFAPFKSAADRELHADYCQSDAVAVGTAVSATPHLTNDEADIVTVVRFKVDDIIKPAPNVSTGSIVMVMRNGGEVTDQGERLRVQVAGRPDYTAGKQYLLFLTPAQGLPVYYSKHYLTIRVSNGHVTPTPDAYVGMKPGEPYSSVKARMESLASQFPCKS